MLQKLFLCVLFPVLLVHVLVALALPPCLGSNDKNTWHNCEGTFP